MAIMRTIDVFYAFPSVLLAIAISGALGAGISNSLLSLTIVFVPPIARVAESVTTSVRALDFVDAARASGAGAFTIIRVHVLGNVLGPVFVYATGLVSVAMILASGLSFLGLGTKPPEPEWGLMLNTLRTAIYSQPLVAALLAPWLGLADPYRGSIARRLRPIGFTTPQGFTHWLGTDEQGRDMLARLVHGARLSLFLGVVPVVNAFVIGSALGILAGYAGG